jgi:glycosyltransferase involved in cell wall biosynthesis
MARVIARTKKDAYLVSVGPYTLAPGREHAMVRLARDVGIGGRFVILADGAGPRDMPALYRGSIGLVFPSLSEGFGLPAIECLASGVPCVVSEVSALPEVVGELGILVDPRNPDDIARGMLRLIEDESHRAMVRVEGPEWAKRFSYKAMSQGYLRVYRELVGAAAGGRGQSPRATSAERLP